VKREYRALVAGVVVAGGTVEARIGRHPTARTRMAVTAAGKPAVTHYRVLERFRAHSYLRVNLETGRTHQIRVHLAHLRHPIVGDPVYGGRPHLPPHPSPALVEALRGLDRQALHAHRLGLAHPVTGEWLEWESPVPADMTRLLDALRADVAEAGG
jgi:23S rRNA pseudouridine1911/1915/1917 synthase